MPQHKKHVTRITSTRCQTDNSADEAETTPSNRLLTTKETAEMIGVAIGTLTSARVHGNKAFPCYTKIGKSVRYKLSTVIEWINNRPEFHSTSQEETTV
jgi:predicted DNA-binding transcriptional regulator AlpA